MTINFGKSDLLPFLAAATVSLALAAGSAFAQGHAPGTDCAVNPGNPDCVHKSTPHKAGEGHMQQMPAHTGTATVPGKTPITPAETQSAAPVAPSGQPNAGENKPGHGGKGG